jgi:hypothetical protein
MSHRSAMSDSGKLPVALLSSSRNAADLSRPKRLSAAYSVVSCLKIT